MEKVFVLGEGGSISLFVL